MTKEIKKTYIWQGTNARNELVKGELEAENIHLARALLRTQNITPKRVKRRSRLSFQGQGRITSKDISLFSRQLATMLKAGVPLIQTLTILQESQPKIKLRKLLEDVGNQLAIGTPLAQALANHPKVFNELFCSLVKAGEDSGSLETMLERVALHQEKIETIKGKIKKAIYYPMFVLLIGFGVAALLLMKVVPEFEKMFASFGADLPVFTQLVIDLSEFMQSHWQYIFGSLFAALLMLIYLRKTSATFRYSLSLLSLRLPIMGQLIHKSAVARFSSTLATSFAAGVTLVEALQAAGRSTGNLVYTRQVEKLSSDVNTGQQLHFAMRMGGLFPTLVVQMVAIGEESGSLDTLLNKVAEFYEEEVNNLVDTMTSLLEPLIILILGVLVGGLILAMYLPIFQMGDLF